MLWANSLSQLYSNPLRFISEITYESCSLKYHLNVRFICRLLNPRVHQETGPEDLLKAHPEVEMFLSSSSESPSHVVVDGDPRNWRWALSINQGRREVFYRGLLQFQGRRFLSHLRLTYQHIYLSRGFWGVPQSIVATQCAQPPRWQSGSRKDYLWTLDTISAVRIVHGFTWQ